MRRDVSRRIERLEQKAGIVHGPPSPNIFLCFGRFGDEQTARLAQLETTNGNAATPSNTPNLLLA